MQLRRITSAFSIPDASFTLPISITDPVLTKNSQQPPLISSDAAVSFLCGKKLFQRAICIPPTHTAVIIVAAFLHKTVFTASSAANRTGFESLFRFHC